MRNRRSRKASIKGPRAHCKLCPRNCGEIRYVSSRTLRCFLQPLHALILYHTTTRTTYRSFLLRPRRPRPSLLSLPLSSNPREITRSRNCIEPALASAKHSPSNPLLKSSYDVILGNPLTMRARDAREYSDILGLTKQRLWKCDLRQAGIFLRGNDRHVFLLSSFLFALYEFLYIFLYMKFFIFFFI